MQPELDASVSKATPDSLQCYLSYSLFYKLCLGQQAWLSKLLTCVKQDYFCFLASASSEQPCPNATTRPASAMGSLFLGHNRAARTAKSNAPHETPDRQHFIVCQSVPSKTTTVAPLLAERQLVPGAAALYESKTLPTSTILSRKQTACPKDWLRPQILHFHLDNWVGKGAASPLLGQSAFY